MTDRLSFHPADVLGIVEVLITAVLHFISMETMYTPMGWRHSLYASVWVSMLPKMSLPEIISDLESRIRKDGLSE